MNRVGNLAVDGVAAHWPSGSVEAPRTTAINALVTDDWVVANYHFAWFLACNTAEVEGVAR
jgi:hypothetical protein